MELAFRSGDTITIYGDMDDDGFFMGEFKGRRGLVPSNFLQEAPLSDDEVLESASVISPARSGESLSNLSRNSDLTADKVGGVAVDIRMHVWKFTSCVQSKIYNLTQSWFSSQYIYRNALFFIYF